MELPPTISQETKNFQLEALSKLLEITRRLAAEHDLDRILKIVTNEVCGALDCERASLFLYDEKTREVYTRVVTELEIEEIRSSVDGGITGWVARHRDVANIPNPAVDARWNSSVDRKTGFHTRNILAAPLISPHEERLVGVLQLLNKRNREFDSFDEQLLQAFAAHAAVALERADLLDDIRKSRALEVAVDMAGEIQRGFLPAKLPDIPGYELAAWWQPAESVGGDYYDILPLPDCRVAIAVADVSGHGVGPSLIMASARAMLHVITRTISDPDMILSLMNETITSTVDHGHFITFLLAALDPKSHTISFANAGHGPAFLLRRDTGEFITFATTGLPLGISGDKPLRAGKPITIRRGDLVVFATDGAIEARNADGELFGLERLQNLIRENRTLPAGELLSVVSRSINHFYPQEYPSDDVTIVILERKRN